MSHSKEYQYAIWGYMRDEIPNLDIETLYDIAGECDYEPADPDECLACYAYIIGQEKEEKENA